MSGLLVKTCTNTAAILLRIFIEMSVDVYMEQFNLLPVGVQTASQSKLNLHEKLKGSLSICILLTLPIRI